MNLSAFLLMRDKMTIIKFTAKGDAILKYYLGVKGLDDLPAAPVFIFQLPVDDNIFFRYFHDL